MESNSMPPSSQTTAVTSAMPPPAAEPSIPVDPYAPIRYSALQVSNTTPTHLLPAPPPPPTPSLSPAPPPPYSSSPPSSNTAPSGGAAIVFQPAPGAVYMSGHPPAAYAQLQEVGQMEGCVQVRRSMSPPNGCVISMNMYRSFFFYSIINVQYKQLKVSFIHYIT